MNTFVMDVARLNVMVKLLCQTGIVRINRGAVEVTPEFFSMLAHFYKVHGPSYYGIETKIIGLFFEDVEFYTISKDPDILKRAKNGYLKYDNLDFWDIQSIASIVATMAKSLNDGNPEWLSILVDEDDSRSVFGIVTRKGGQELEDAGFDFTMVNMMKVFDVMGEKIKAPVW